MSGKTMTLDELLAAERERCAKVCAEIKAAYERRTDSIATGKWLGANYCENSIRALPALPVGGMVVPRWIPVRERLPDKGIDVLCYWGPHTPCEVGMCSLGGRFGTIWQSSNGDMHEFDADPTHWMPLPAAQGEGK